MATEDLAAEAERFRRRNRAFGWVTLAALAAIGLFVALNLAVLALKPAAFSDETLRRMAIAWSPVAFYAWALWSAFRLFTALSREGFAFHDEIARGLGRIGVALALGGALSVVTGLVLLFGGPVGAGGFPVFNAPGLTVAVVGLTLVAIAGLVRRAEQLRERNQRLKARLEDFL